MGESAERQGAEEMGSGVDLGRGWIVAIVATVLFAGIAVFAVAPGNSAEHSSTESEHWVGDPLAEDGEADSPGTSCSPPPAFKTEEVMDSIEETGHPCSGCHNQELQTNPKRRELNTHDDFVLRHDEQHRWCLDCHDAENRDKLRLASGVLIEYAESYRLCGQCHGDKYRDWRRGIHGRRVGNWNGDKEYMLCVHCHSAHAPRFQPLEPMPPPTPQGEIR